MKQAFPCVGLLLAALLAGCEVSTQPAPVPSTPISLDARPVGSAPIAAPVRASVPQVARGHLQFVEGYAQGLQQAQADHKPMLVFFTAEWCHFCHQMADEAFTSPQVVALAQQQFVCVLVDADAEAEVCRQFRVQAFPTVQFVSARGIPLNRVVGKRPSQQVMTAMQAALQSVARRPSSSDHDRPL